MKNLISSEKILNGQIGLVNDVEDHDAIKGWKPNLILIAGPYNDFDLISFMAKMINNNIPVFRIKDKVNDAFILRSLKIIAKDILIRGGNILVLGKEKDNDVINFLKEHLS